MKNEFTLRRVSDIVINIGLGINLLYWLFLLMLHFFSRNEYSISVEIAIEGLIVMRFLVFRLFNDRWKPWIYPMDVILVLLLYFGLKWQTLAYINILAILAVDFLYVQMQSKKSS